MDSNLNFDELYAVMLKITGAQFMAMPKNHKEVSLDELRGYLEGKFPNGKPIEFIQTSGNAARKPDLIIPSSLGWTLYHKNLIQLFAEKGFTGWESYPVKVFCKNGEVNEDYHAFSVKGVCGHYDVKRSEIIDYTADNGGFILREKRYLGMYFDSKSWDGTDIFMMENTTRIIVTEPVMQELKRRKAKVNMTRLSEQLLLDKVE
ncbi:MAG: hypothetical protein E7290_05865 [Lachnospiraceae bacterium]|nr:hypothetical protein [Lachnospiraceae bacterium]